MAPIKSLLSGLLIVPAAASLRGHETGHEKAFIGEKAISEETGKGHGHQMGHRQTPEELGFTSDGDVDGSSQEYSRMAADFCLDLGAKGFPLPVFDMMQAAGWNAQRYFENIQIKGYAEDALQMSGPQDAILKSDCMRAGRGKVKHIFVGDSQMMALRNAFHRLNGCPEIWWNNSTEEVRKLQERKLATKQAGRLHSFTQQAPDSITPGCREDGVASFIYWDAWAQPDMPLNEIEHEIEQLGLSPKDGADTVVAWVGSNHISAMGRMGALQDIIDKMHTLGVKLVWDSPTFQDTAIITATSTHDEGRDPHTGVPISYTKINKRRAEGKLGSGLYQTEKALLESGVEIPMTRRWQLTNRYRGLQCDGMHTDMRARDPVFYNMECHRGTQRYGHNTNGCNWVEPFKTDIVDFCPQAAGLDDLVLQSGLYGICANHERPFCYQHTEHIR